MSKITSLFRFFTAASSLVLKPPESCVQSTDPTPVESRIKQDKSDYEEKERQRFAQEARAERRQKKQVGSFFPSGV